jgi:DNA-binding response OmpR family regulator
MAEKRSLRVVVVDDYVDATDTLALLLQMAGYEVLRSYAGADAIEKASAYHVDVVIIDLAMPEVDGYEVARQIRRREACKDALLIAVTGLVEERYRERARKAGFDYYFVKPVDFNVLREVVDSQLSRHAPPDQA